MSLKDLTAKQLDVWKNYSKQGTHDWTAEVAIQDLSYQIGSLAKIQLQLKNYRYHEGLSKEQLQEKMSDELADILADTLFIAHDLGIDLEEAFMKMLDSDKNKIKTRSEAA